LRDHPTGLIDIIPAPARHYCSGRFDRVAANGSRYTNFNSTALCSPTRAAIITGRNHHSMGFGVIAEQSTGYRDPTGPQTYAMAQGPPQGMGPMHSGREEALHSLVSRL